jgi:hypothetical protein
LAQRDAVSPSMTVAATAPRRPRSAQSAVLGRHISITVSAGWPSASSRRADLTKGHALTHSTRSRKRAIHFRPLAVGSIKIRSGAAGPTGVAGPACATFLRWFGVVRCRTLWTSAPVAVPTAPGLPFSWSRGGLRGVVERFRGEHLSNKFPQFSPRLLGEITPCSRLTNGRTGSGRSFKSCFCWSFLVGAWGRPRWESNH